MIEVSDYVDVKKKAQELELNVPSSIAVLPRNFEEAKSKGELVNESTTPTVRTLWRKNGISETPLEKAGERFPLLVESGFDWVSPVIFVSALVMSQNPLLVDLAINVIANYLTDFFKGIVKEEQQVKFSIVVETRTKGCKKMKYEGPRNGIEDVAKLIKNVWNE